MSKRNIFVASLFFVLILTAFIFRGFVAFSDSASTWFNPFFRLKEIFYSWNSLHLTGFYISNNLTNLFLSAFYSLISILFKNPEQMQKMVWIVFVGISGLYLIKLINNILNNIYLSLLSVLFIFFNPISQYYFWGVQHWTYYLIVPYMISILKYTEYIRDNKRKHFFEISFVWFIFGFCFTQPAYFVSFLVIIFILFLFNIIRSGLKPALIKDHALFAFIFISFNFCYLYPLFVGGTYILNNEIITYSKNTYTPILSDLKDFNFFYSFVNISMGKNDYFFNYQIFTLLWTGFLGFLLYLGFVRFNRVKRKSSNDYIFIFSVIFVLFIFLNKGISSPFSELSNILYNHKLMYIFRAFKEKLAIGYSITLSLMFIYAFLDKKLITRIILIISSVLFYLMFLYNIWYPKNYTSAQTFMYFDNLKIPNIYQSRILNLPLTNYSFFYTENPVYEGDNPIRNIFEKDTIFSAYGQDNLTQTIKKGLDTDTLTPELFEQYLKTYNIEYILVNKNSYVKQDDNPKAFSATVMTKYMFLNLISSNDKFDLYRYDGYLPRISGENILFKKINPTKYEIYISHLETDTTISFLETYHPGWNLFLNRYPEKITCNNARIYKTAGTSECLGENKFIAVDDLFRFFDKPVFSDQHEQIYSYGNLWKIDKNTVIKHFGRGFYKTNPNNSIDISLTLYFSPQNNYYISMLVSFISIISVIYLFTLNKKL